MATYDVTQSIPEKIKTGDILNCPYSGRIISLTLPKGEYKFECWGANGYTANSSYSKGGNGGYSYGTYKPTEESTIHLVSGGIGTVANSSGSGAGGGGYNGGGNGYRYSSYYGGGGGGASHIATTSSLLSARSSDYTSTVFLVAGGGGGTAYRSSSYAGNGGMGGGASGGDGTASYSSSYRGTGATQTAPGYGYNANYCKGSFGQGGNNYSTGSTYYVGGGGGGLYGGGGGYRYGAAGGGGSGYVNTSLLINTSTAQQSTSTNPDTTNHAGYIRITAIKVDSLNIFAKLNNTWIKPKKIFYKNGNSTNKWVEITNKILVRGSSDWHDPIPTNILPSLTYFTYDGAYSQYNAQDNTFEAIYPTTSGLDMVTYDLPTPIPGHLYYGRIEQLRPSGSTVADGRFEYYQSDTAGTGLMTFVHFSECPADGQWHSASSIQSVSSLASATGWKLRMFSVSNSGILIRRNPYIVDLTETYGAGNEPTKEWCDANLRYKDSTFRITRSIMDHNGTFVNVTPTYLTNQVDGSDGFTIVGRNSQASGSATFSGNLRMDINFDLTKIQTLTFNAKKGANHGVVKICIDETQVLFVHYNDLPTNWTAYSVDLSSYTGTRKVSFIGGYTDSSGNTGSSTSYCNIEFNY